MKKITVLAAFLGVFMGEVLAWENPGFEWGVGVEATSAYLWRGQYLGGLSLQPDASVGYGGLVLDAWFNLSPTDYTFKTFNPEMDLTLSYSISALTVGVTQFYYFDGSKFFSKKPTLSEYATGDYGSSQTEVFARLDLGEWLPKIPLSVFWGTYVAGADHYIEGGTVDVVGDNIVYSGNPKLKRAFSTYIEVSYKADLPLGFSITPTVGMSPWKSMYNFYEKNNFSVNNIQLRADWEFELTHHFRLDVYAQVMMNTYGLNKDNAFTKAAWRNAENGKESQRLNGSIGVGIFLE